MFAKYKGGIFSHVQYTENEKQNDGYIPYSNTSLLHIYMLRAGIECTSSKQVIHLSLIFAYLVLTVLIMCKLIVYTKKLQLLFLNISKENYQHTLTTAVYAKKSIA